MTHERLSFNGRAVGFGDEAPSSPDPKELPSSRSAIDFVEGKPGAFWRVGAHMLLRTALIGGGMYALGADRGPKLWMRAAGGSLAIEVFAIGWVLVRRSQEQG